MRLLLGFLVSTCATLAVAEGLPMDFSSFAPGTRFDYRDSESGPFVDIYVGEENGLHVIERHLGNEYTETELTRFFSAQGLEVRREYANGRIVSYAPFNCERGVGDCRHEITSARGTTPVTTTTYQENGGYTMEMAFASGNLRRRFFRLGDHGVMEFIRENDRQSKLESIRPPGQEFSPTRP
ncbi:MAG: hypothetical protein AAGA47_12150 [Pseudomonadota bacterium]